MKSRIQRRWAELPPYRRDEMIWAAYLAAVGAGFTYLETHLTHLSPITRRWIGVAEAARRRYPLGLVYTLGLSWLVIHILKNPEIGS
jgi:hypothetical protein